MPGDERSTTLIDLFDEQVRRTPDAVAVVGHEETLTYAELSVRVDGLAARLEVGKGALVAVHLDRSVRLVVAVYAVLRVGAAYVPLDPDYPDDRIAFMVADAGADVVITEKALLEQLPQVECRVITVDDGDLSQVMPPSGPRKSPAGPDDLAYVIYTSGSTGRPKGVMISHAAIVNRILWMQSEYGLSADDRVLHKTPFSFDVSVWELFWPLLCGASMVVARAGGHRDSAYLINLIKRERVTTVHFVPSMLRIFLEDPSVTACVGLRRVFCSGEALTRALQDRFFDLLDVPLHNLYGPTEAAVDVTYWPCERNSDLATVPIGYPVANTQIYLLDESGEPVSAGTVGRLFIGGVQVAVGYLGRPELTADRFVPDPFTDRPGARMYDSGDLARSLPNGAFDYVGRADGQVKLHGQRIELGEIESILDLHSGVGQSVVIVTWDDVGEGRLVAYWVVAGGGSSPTEDALREHLAARVPGYMVPQIFVQLDDMPLGPSGKVDRARLPAPLSQKSLPTPSSLDPGDPLERYLSGLWREILDLDQIERTGKFFELGGTSLQAARLTNRVQRDLGETIFVIALFDAPTVAEYASFLRSEYPAAVGRLTSTQSRTGAAPQLEVNEMPPVSDELMRRFAKLVPELTGTVRASKSKNPRAAFILAPPRSGTTLLRVMLAGHPEIFAASELQLLGFSTLQQREVAYSGRFGLWLDGTIRALMDLLEVGPDEARRHMDAATQADMTTQQFFRKLQALAAPRLLIDKTPSYALDPGALAKAERDFEDPFYIHLVRHPVPVVRSFVRHHMDQALYLRDHDLKPRQVAELVWTLSHQVVTDFLDDVPATRWHRIRFEDLVTEPRAELTTLCDRMGLAFDDQLLDPYGDLEAKMVDGIFPDSRPMGDTRFMEYDRVRADAADAWRVTPTDTPLGVPTIRVAARLGLEPDEVPATNRSASSGRAAVAAQRQRRRREGKSDA